jgi:predicted ribosome quality control (RQC) complex YloA/Tae2 family protein
MTSNYYTLRALVREIGPKIVGAIFLEAYSHRPSELRIRLDSGTIVAILRPISGAIFLSSQEERRPKQNIHPFFQDLQGKRLSSISLAENDRIITLEFEDLSLKLSFFGTPNAVLSQNGEVIESYKKLSENPNPLPPREKFAADLLGKRYLREAAARGISPDDLAELILNSDTAFIHSHNDEILLSLISLESLRGWSIEKEESVNAAIRKVITTRASLARVGGLRKRLLDKVESEIERLSRSLVEMQKGVENSERAERYSAIGNAILQSAYLIEKGANAISITIDEKPFEAKLEPDISPHQNAARYFEKAKMARAAKDGLRDRSVKSRNEIEKLSGIRDRIIAVPDIRALEQIELREPTVSKEAQTPSGFREFTVFGGMKVLVGRNAKQNDELTTHTAKKEDLWLHARGVPGSHVVLQTGGRKQIPKEAIEQAAELAAFYSEAKTQSLAPVSYTLKKYVRKPKGAGPGAVVMEREEVIMVEPRSGNKDES